MLTTLPVRSAAQLSSATGFSVAVLMKLPFGRLLKTSERDFLMPQYWFTTTTRQIGPARSPVPPAPRSAARDCKAKATS
jgi:hypothetical protein